MGEIRGTTLPVFRRSVQRLVILACLGACTINLPAAPVPPAVPPPISSPTPPPAGQGRLIIDVVDGPTPVQRVDMASEPIKKETGFVTYRFSEAPRQLCPQTPCLAHVPAGTNILLGFPVIGSESTETELVHIGPEPSVYRRSLSVYHRKGGGGKVLGIIMTSVGGAALAAGATFLPIGLAKDIDGMTIAGGASLGAGTALLVVGILMIRANSPTYRPGSSNHYPVNP